MNPAGVWASEESAPWEVSGFPLCSDGAPGGGAADTGPSGRWSGTDGLIRCPGACRGTIPPFHPRQWFRPGRRHVPHNSPFRSNLLLRMGQDWPGASSGSMTADGLRRHPGAQDLAVGKIKGSVDQAMDVGLLIGRRARYPAGKARIQELTSDTRFSDPARIPPLPSGVTSPPHLESRDVLDGIAIGGKMVREILGVLNGLRTSRCLEQGVEARKPQIERIVRVSSPRCGWGSGGVCRAAKLTSPVRGSPQRRWGWYASRPSAPLCDRDLTPLSPAYWRSGL